MSITTIALAVVLGLPLTYLALVIVIASLNYMSGMAARRRLLAARRRNPF
jgi:hypothetical protein